MFFKNVALGKEIKVSKWRKSALGTYNQSGDCQVYCIQSLDVQKSLDYINSKDSKVTLTHLAGKAAGLMIEKYPEINNILRFGKLFPRQDISIFFQVAVDTEGKDLSGHTVRNINQKTIDCGWTLDHRIIDGVVGAKMAMYFKELMENPELLD